MIRHGWAREAVGVAWRALLVLFVVVWFGRSLAILAALFALAGVALAAVAVGVRALLVRRRGW